METSRGLQGIDVRMRDRTSVYGGIRWFDPAGTGRGLIIPDEGGPHLHFDNSGITRIGLRRLIPSERVSFSLRRGHRGLEAVDVAVLSERMRHGTANEPRAEIKHRTAVDLAKIAADRISGWLRSTGTLSVPRLRERWRSRETNVR